MNTIIVCSYQKELIPEKQSTGAVCRDIKSAKDVTIKPNQCTQVQTGIKIYTPLGRSTKIYVRSGLPIKKWLMLANGTAIIDSDYRGEYIVLLYNFMQSEVCIEKYTRIAQIEFCPYYIDSQQYGTINPPKLKYLIDQKVYDEFDKHYPTQRWEGRFHSTGSK